MLWKKKWLILFEQIREDFTDKVIFELALSVGRRQKGVSDKRNFMERQLSYEPTQYIKEIVVGKCLEGKCRIESPQNETIGPNHKGFVFRIIVWLCSLGSSRAMEHYKKS